MKKKYAGAILILLLLITVSIGVLRLWVEQPEVRFSEKDAFQTEAFDLKLSTRIPGMKIYYTLNGDEPTLDSDVYTEPIHVEEGLPEKVTVVRAAVLEGGGLGKTYTQTYFVGADVKNLFDVMLVSLSADQLGTLRSWRREFFLIMKRLERTESGPDRPILNFMIQTGH